MSDRIEHADAYGPPVEEWRPVVGYEGRYDVSNYGRVRSLRFRNRMCDKPRATPLILSQESQRGKHHQVGIADQQPLVHLMVLEAFVGPCPSDKAQGAHWDGNPHNNTVWNLRWATRSENCADQLRHGTYPRGSQNGNSVLTEADIPIIREMKKSASYTQVAKKYGVTKGQIKHIIMGRQWRHV